MKEILISQFIDDELTLNEKKEFVSTIHNDESFYIETIDFIDSEISFRGEMSRHTPPELSLKPKKLNNSIYKFAIAAIILISLSFFGKNMINFETKSVVSENIQKEYRFVIYNDTAKNVQLSGSFTDWKKIPMKRIKNSNYWEITVKLPKGEHRYSIIADDKILTDPTATFIEKDDFGNENSVLQV